ncbi:MAG: aldo/keto reductase, partial [Candidatus Latescibacteria bacterium]|nr:aldo/keto reductase [Candidatus Latescibacterota bacterium]
GQPAPEGTPWTGDRFERVMTERVEAVVAVLVELGQQLGKTPAQLAMAWLLDHEEVTAPIVGPDMPEHVEETFGALDGTLPAEVRQRLDEVSLVELPARYDRQ